nr:MAG TPA: hypothetical protein [Caudoviricetes sp.]
MYYYCTVILIVLYYSTHTFCGCALKGLAALIVFYSNCS